jgi:hypothetical protein
VARETATANLSVGAIAEFEQILTDPSARRKGFTGSTDGTRLERSAVDPRWTLLAKIGERLAVDTLLAIQLFVER